MTGCASLAAAVALTLALGACASTASAPNVHAGPGVNPEIGVSGPGPLENPTPPGHDGARTYLVPVPSNGADESAKAAREWGDVQFEHGLARIGQESLNRLGILVHFLSENPTLTARIEGFTEDLGSEDANRGLSQQRADAVKVYLVEQGIDSGRLTAAGMGTSSKGADRASPSRGTRNDRVDVVVID